MGSFQEQLDAARVARDWRALQGFFVGLIAGGIITQDLLLSLLSGIVLGLIVGVISSGQVDKLKQIQRIGRQ